jgi:F-type H+-transporting ATPase subunit b
MAHPILLAQAEAEFRQDLQTSVEQSTELHDEAHGGAFPPFEPTYFASQIIWLAITFGLLYFLLKRVALPRVAGILEDRNERIQKDLSEAQRLKNETDAAIASYEASLAAARASSQKIANETRAAVDAEAAQKRKAIEAELTDRLAQAEARIAATKTQAMTNVRAIAVDAASAIVQRLSGSEPSGADVDAAVDQALRG